VGFYLWLDRDLAWAQGAYEYRPMGTAVIAASDLFRRRDFDPRRKLPGPGSAQYAGQFASLGHLNGELKKRRRRSFQPSAISRQPKPAPRTIDRSPLKTGAGASSPSASIRPPSQRG